MSALKEQRSPRAAVVLRFGDRRVQRRRRQRLSRAGSATQVLGSRARCASPPTARAIPTAIASSRFGLPREFGFRHEIVHTRELERPEYRANPANRCYYCKHELYTPAHRRRAERGSTAIVDGNNADDRGDYRPGRQAAREFGVRSPLDEVDLTKDEIRELSHRAGLPTWDEPASACLSSRIPYHSEVTDEKLRMIERAERRAARARLPRLPRAAPRSTRADRDRPRRAAARARAGGPRAAIVAS